jgi:hypothetical protein
MSHLGGLGELLGGVGGLVLAVGGLIVICFLGYLLLAAVVESAAFILKYLGGPLIIAAGIWVIVAYGTSGGGWFVGLCLIAWGAAVLKDVLDSN